MASNEARLFLDGPIQVELERKKGKQKLRTYIMRVLVEHLKDVFPEEIYQEYSKKYDKTIYEEDVEKKQKQQRLEELDKLKRRKLEVEILKAEAYIKQCDVAETKVNMKVLDKKDEKVYLLQELKDLIKIRKQNKADPKTTVYLKELLKNKDLRSFKDWKKAHE